MGTFRIVEALESRRLLSVDLDPGFGQHGVLNIGVGGVRASASTADGKVLITGQRIIHRANKSDVVRPFVTRLLVDGTPDPSLGGVEHGQPDGTPEGTVVVTNLALTKVYDIVALPDGSILLGGSACTVTAAMTR